ncbi:MAG: FkbM family methyltransferase [Pseudomonadota bacterium]
MLNECHNCQLTTAALYDKISYLPFHYSSIERGMANNHVAPQGNALDAKSSVFQEAKITISVDELLRAGMIAPADIVKMDVDGNERFIIKGMQNFLQGYYGKKPRLIQIEVMMREFDLIRKTMSGFGYKNTASIPGSSDKTAHNMIFIAQDSTLYFPNFE